MKKKKSNYRNVGNRATPLLNQTGSRNSALWNDREVKGDNAKALLSSKSNPRGNSER